MHNSVTRSQLSNLARLFMLVASVAGFCATDAMAKGDFRPKATQTTTNGILSVSIEGTTGQFTITTGASHPQPGKTVFFPIGTGFTTLRDATSLQMFVNCSTPNPGLTGYTSVNMCTTPPVTTSLASGFRTTFTIPNWTLVQDIVINGTTLSDTNVSETFTVTNTSGASRQYGVRFMWDWEIANNDGSFFRTRSPDGTFSNIPVAFNAPTFPIYEEVDNIATPTFSVFATVGGGSLNPPPTTPERFRYSNWPSSVGSAWDYTDPVTATGDSSVSYFWGFTTPLTLAAGGSASYTQYVTTQLSAVGPPVPPAVVAVPTPTLNEWTLLLLAGLVVAIGGGVLHRRRG